MKFKRIAICVFVIGLLIPKGISAYQEYQYNNSGIPDIVNSVSMNQEERLTVVASSREIEDAESFARQVIRRCQDNSFKSIRFSTDVNGYPHSLEISVYLQKDDIGEKEPIHKIEFLPDEWNQGYDIKNDVEHFQLLLDGKEIEFY